MTDLFISACCGAEPGWSAPRAVLFVVLHATGPIRAPARTGVNAPSMVFRVWPVTCYSSAAERLKTKRPNSTGL